MSKRLGKLAKRYAKALLGSIAGAGVSATEGLTESQSAAQGLLSFAEVWEKDPQLASVIANPMFDAHERIKALEGIATAMKLPDVTSRFLRVLFERDRIAAVAEVAEAFSELADDAANVVPVTVTTARAIDESERKEIEVGLKRLIDGKAAYVWNVDAKLLGGMVISYRGKMIDGSLSGRLENLEKRLVG